MKVEAEDDVSGNVNDFEVGSGAEAIVVSSHPPSQQPVQQQLQNHHQAQQSMCPPDCTIWMGDLSLDWDANFIRDAFGKYNQDITNVKMVTTDHGSKKATYCFVEFRSEESARTAILDVNGNTFSNDPTGQARFNLAFANSPNHMQVEYNLFVNNLAPIVDDVGLFRLFGERYRSCRGAKVYRDEEGRSKEQGFVRFISETDQQKALVEMNKQQFHGRELLLKLARPKTRGTGRYGHGRGGGMGGGGHMMGGGGMGMGGYQQSGGGFIDNLSKPNQGQMQGMLLSQMQNQMDLGMVPLSLQNNPIPFTIAQQANPYNQVPAVGQMPTAMPMMANGMPGMQYVAGIMPGAQIAVATPYGAHSQMAPNHGMAGFGGGGAMIAPQHFAGQPFVVGGATAYQQGPYIPPQFQQAHIIHPGPLMAPIAAVPFPGQQMAPPPHFNQQKPQPAPPVYEDVEPLTAEEHNALLLNSNNEFSTAIEASRWCPVAFPTDTRKKELQNILP